MKTRLAGLISVCAGVLSLHAQTLRTAGTLAVDVTADTITAADGDAVTSWANGGTLGAAFNALAGMTGAVFTNSLLGRKAVLFDGTAQSVLVGPSAPSSLTGESTWSIEAWVWVPSPPPAKAVYLSWTEDETAGTGWQAWSRLMMRYDTGGVQVDFRGGAMGSNYGMPASGLWHHLAVARAPTEMLTFYVDGSRCNQGGLGDVNLQGGKPLALGGVLRVETSAYTNFFAGALSRVRVHTGTLSEDDVRHNYLTDVPAYRAGGYAAWNGGAGYWNDPAFWQDGRVGAGLDAVRVQSGSLTVTNDDVSASSLAMLDLRAGTIKLITSAARIDARTPFLVGRESGQAAAINVSSGVLHVVSSGNPAYLDLGVSGALSTLEVGGSGAAATLYTAQLRAFAEGASDVRVMKGGVIEMDALFADALSVPAVSVAGGTFRNRTGGTMGYFFNVPQVNVSTDGVTFDTPAGAVMAVAAPLLHDASGPASGGGLRKIGNGTLILSGTNSYAGATSVEAGTLMLAPRLLDGLVYRLDASADALDTLTLDASSNVLAWTDCSGAGFVFTTNKTEMSPVYEPALFGGRGGLRFSRDNTCYRLATDRAAKIQTVFAVITPAADNNIDGLWGRSEQDYGIRLQATAVQYTGNANDFAASGAVYTNGAFGNGFTVGQPFVMTAIAGSPQTWVTAIGDYWGNLTHRRAYRGDIAEILTYDRRLDDRERQEIERYLMAKWLGTVPAPVLADRLLPHAGTLAVNAGASVDLHGSSATLSALLGAGVIGNGQPATSLLTVGADDAEFAFAGSVTGNVAVSKTGAGRVVFAGQNTLSGPLTVEAGTLTLASDASSVTGLVYRLDASQPATLTFLADGSNVTAWADAEGSGFAFATTNDLNCPVYNAALFGGRGGLHFGRGGARGRMLGSGVTNAQTVFAVNMIRDQSNDNGGFWGKEGQDSGLRIGNTTWYWPGNNNDFHYGGAGGLVAVNGIVSNSVVTVGQIHLVTSVNGARQTFRPAIGDYWGSSQWTSRYYRGDVAEILVYDRSLTALERQTVEAALMAKWFPAGSGSVLPSSASVTVQAGGTLDLAGGAFTVASLSGGGCVSNGALTVTGSVAPDGELCVTAAAQLTGTLVLTVEADGSCDSLALAGALDLSGLALELHLPVEPPAVGSYTLITAAGGIQGVFEQASVAKPWRLVVEPTAVRLTYVSGTLMLLK